MEYTLAVSTLGDRVGYAKSSESFFKCMVRDLAQKFFCRF